MQRELFSLGWADVTIHPLEVECEVAWSNEGRFYGCGLSFCEIERIKCGLSQICKQYYFGDGGCQRCGDYNQCP